VATVPGYHGGAQDAETLADAAQRIGFPVLIKASAGGGGRGMRRVDRAEDFADALAAAKAEADAAFGDSTVLLEKFILNPRHLEVQLAGDRHGGLVHLFERDCSVQRNNQKLLEEAPAPNLPDNVRTMLHQAALKLGRAIGYDSAGTVEFIMEQNGDAPYFLEMNTRLQVEHPVTEAITGIDLVEWQLLAAAGEPLPLRQEEISRRGHAIEARLTAERADLAFQPVTGRLVLVDPPHGLRLDSGVEAGSEVGLYYDSLLAKLIAHGSDREAALTRLSAGLTDLVLLGMPTIQPFLRDATRHPLFAEGKATTRFIETAFPGGWKPDADELMRLRALAAIVWADLEKAPVATDWANPWSLRSALRVNGRVRPGNVSLHAKDEYGEVEMRLGVSHDGITADFDGRTLAFERGKIGAIAARRSGDTVYISGNGLAISTTFQPKIDRPAATQALDRAVDAIAAPLHGVVSMLHVALGDTIEKGMPVLQMEAMKLVHTLKAPMTGRIRSLHCAVGDTVPAGAILVEISPETAIEENV
jgi:acetyl/propionyl-CoA carboxylase alpha subunit